VEAGTPLSMQAVPLAHEAQGTEFPAPEEPEAAASRSSVAPAAAPPVPETAGDARAEAVPSEEAALDVLDRVCRRLEERAASPALVHYLRAAGVRQFGHETVLLLGQGRMLERQQLEDARYRPALEQALADELDLPHVRVRIEMASGPIRCLLDLDAEERRRQEKRWIGLAGSIEGVKRVRELFEGRITSISVEEEDGETTVITVEEA
jgi:hypothetical protein